MAISLTIVNWKIEKYMNIIRFFLPNAYQIPEAKDFLVKTSCLLGSTSVVDCQSLTAEFPRWSQPQQLLKQATPCSAHVCIWFQVLKQTSVWYLAQLVWQVLQQGRFVVQVQIPTSSQHERKESGEIGSIRPLLSLHFWLPNLHSIWKANQN